MPGLSLAGSTNAFTITMTDAAGNSSNQSLTIRQSAIGLTINPVSADELAGTFIALSGSLSDSSQHVWVNGNPATVASGGWSANIPAPDGGTALVIVQAGPDQSNLLGEQAVYLAMPSRIKVMSYLNHYRDLDLLFDSGDEIIGTVRNYDQQWEKDVGGESRSFGSSAHGFGTLPPPYSYYNTVVEWPGFWPDGQSFDGTETDNSGPSEAYSETAALPWQFAQQSAYAAESGDYAYIVRDTVQTKLGLVTGGSALPGTQSLIRLTVSVAGYSASLALNPASSFRVPGDIPVPATSLRVFDQPVVATATNEYVGEVWVVAAAGSIQDIPVTVNGTSSQLYSLDAKAEDYGLSIQANGVTLDSQKVVSNAEFCVGQKLTFATNWSRVPSGVQSRVAHWTISGTYVNDHVHESANSSTNYFINTDLLTNETTSAWWVSGGMSPPATYTAKFSENLTFTNGRQLVISAKGQFSMFRPSVVMLNSAVNGAASNVWITPWNFFHFGRIGLGQPGGPNNMSFYLQVLSSDFPGNAKIAQLCTLDATGISSVTNFLDNSDPYPNTAIQVLTNSVNPFNGNTNNIIQLDDAPQNGSIGSFHLVGNFIDYIMFTPIGATNIYVPLGRVTWGTSFGASFPSTNISPNSVTNPTDPDNSQEWPRWPDVFSNPN